jgi:hypothetical protein
MDHANKGIELEDIEARLAALERATEVSRDRRFREGGATA